MTAPVPERTDGTKIRYSDRGKYLFITDPDSGRLVSHGVITGVNPVESSDGRDNWSQSYAEISLDTGLSAFLYAGTQAFLLPVPQAPRPDLDRLKADIRDCRAELVSAALAVATAKMISASKGLSPDTAEDLGNAERLDLAAKALTKALTKYHAAAK